MHGAIQKCIKSFPEGGKRPLGRPRCSWEDNIKMDLREVGCDAGDWIDLTHDRDSISLSHILYYVQLSKQKVADLLKSEYILSSTSDHGAVT